MNALVKNRIHSVLLAITVTLMMMVAAAPLAAYSVDNSLGFTVSQVFSDSSNSTNATFTYRLKPLVATNPMPAGSTAEGYTFSITGKDNKNVSPIYFSKTGIYEYTLYNVAGTGQKGYTYDSHVYNLKFFVDGSLNIILVAFNADGTKAENIVFEAGYHTAATDPKLMVDPPVKKTVSGKPAKNSTFSFSLVAKNASCPMPAGSANGVKTIKIVGAGEGEFGTWSYTKAGTYYYSVHEVNSGDTEYTYDTAVYSIKDTVTDEDGQLVLSRVVTNNDNKKVTDMKFVNKYTKGGGKDDGKNGGLKGSTYKTGDNMNALLYIVALAASGIFVIIIAARMKKQKKDAAY